MPSSIELLSATLNHALAANFVDAQCCVCAYVQCQTPHRKSHLYSYSELGGVCSELGECE